MNVPVGVAVAAVLAGTQIWDFILFCNFLAPRWRPPVVGPHSTKDWDAVRPVCFERRIKDGACAFAMRMRHDVMEGVWFWRVLLLPEESRLGNWRVPWLA
jgi:hypothetical protein